MGQIPWEQFEKMAVADKAACLSEDGKLFHILYAQQFTRAQLEQFGALATKIRMIAKTEKGSRFLLDLLPHKRVMLYFTQPSTRTFLSFCAACQILGINIGEVRDTATSSELKGESREDSIRTFSSYYDLIVMRSEIGGLAEKMAWTLSGSDRPVPIINAGSGKDQHPTQALLDIYTLQRSFEERGGIDGKTVVFVGDLARGRTVRSLSYLLATYRDVKQVFVAPASLQISPDVTAMLDAAKVKYELSEDFEAGVRKADALYMTRIQDEWDSAKGESGRIDISSFSLRKEHMRLLGKKSVVLHPLPRRTEIAVEVDHDPRAVYWRQMRNGMWVRAALIAGIFGISGAIMDRAAR